MVPLGPELTTHGLAAQVLHDKWLYLTGLVVACVVAVALLLLTGRHAKGAAVTFAAVLAGTLLVGGVALAGGGQATGLACRDEPLYRYLQTLPKDTIVAGDPIAINCVPIAAERPVLMSQKLYQVYDRNVFRFARPRMFAEVRAYYGGSLRDIVRLRTMYGADVVVVNRNLLGSGRSYQYSRMATVRGTDETSQANRPRPRDAAAPEAMHDVEPRRGGGVQPAVLDALSPLDSRITAPTLV